MMTNPARASTCVTLAMLCLQAPFLVGAACAADAAQPVVLTGHGKALQAKYEKQLAELRTEIRSALPALDEGQRAAFMKAHAAEAAVPYLDTDPQFKAAVSRSAEAAAPLLKATAGLLSDGRLDAKLVTCAVLANATPRGLALFAQRGAAEEALVEQLLADPELMKKMLTAGGAKEGKYGEAMKIFTDIRKTSARVREPGILRNLALGISLEMTVPYGQRYGTYLSQGVRPVDPVARYQQYEKAYLAGELDPAFKDMTAWECRWIACDPSPDEDLVWLRTMLRNYRPDLARYPDPKWYYTRIIKTDVRYARHPWDPSQPTSRLQQAIDQGGICHIRAWIARATARAFGIPARRVEQGGANPPTAPEEQ